LGRFGVQGGCWYRCRLAAAHSREVELRRHAPRQEVVAAIREADLVLLTSRNEASPLVILEAMAAGTPWVSFDAGCVRSQAGGIVARTREEMVGAAVALLRDGALRADLGSRGRESAAASDWGDVARRYERLLLEAASRRTPNRRQEGVLNRLGDFDGLCRVTAP
jgi:glycosyltransferase involved in cell wall biosynthesis